MTSVRDVATLAIDTLLAHIDQGVPNARQAALDAVEVAFQGVELDDTYASDDASGMKFTMVEIGKVCTIINGQRACLGAAGVTNVPPGARCPLCKAKPKKDDAWPFWPLVGLVCTDCSREVCEATPWEPLEFWPDGRVMTCITRAEP